MVLGVLGYATFEFVSQATGRTGHVGHAAVSTPHAVPRHAAASAMPRAAQAARPAATATAAATAAPAVAPAKPAAAAPPPVRTLVPVSAVAFGPQGTADGDNPQNAARVLTDPAQGWLTDWYTTAEFGALQSGTGLLLDMGRTVTITAVRLTQGFPGADLQLRAGAAPDLSALPVVAAAADVGDTANLPLAVPTRARYVLLWFTRLPPDGAGTYQVFVHRVTVRGRP